MLSMTWLVVDLGCAMGLWNTFTVSKYSLPEPLSIVGTSAMERHGPSLADRALDSSEREDWSTGVRP